MRIVDGVAYADSAAQEVKVLDIRTLEEYKLWLRFSNGETGVFDFSPLLKYDGFASLRDKEVFSRVEVEYGVPIWNGGETDISPKYLYDNFMRSTVQEEA